MQPPDVIRTERLLLRRPTEADAAALFGYQSNAEVTLYLAFPTATDISEAYAFLRRCETVWDEGVAFPLGIINEEGKFVGMIELRPIAHRVQVGYVLTRNEWGKGYMTEALSAATDWAFRQPDVLRVSAFCDIENVGSQRVLEKAGFIREGMMHRFAIHPNASSEPRDVVMYARW